MWSVARAVTGSCVLAVLVAIPALPAAQSTTTPWAIDVTHEHVDVTTNGVDSVWTTNRAQVSWVRPEIGGWFGSVERQQRGSQVDASISARGYRRNGDWTLGGGGAVSPAADFLYRYAADGELSRRVVGTVVLSGAYRYLAFRTVTLHQVQPALAWYHPKGDVQARLFLTRNVEAQRTSPTVLVRTTFDATARLRLGGGAAYGDRVFDPTLLPTGRARSRVVFGNIRVGVTAHDAIDVGASFAHEEPAFDFRSFTVGYRRVF